MLVENQIEVKYWLDAATSGTGKSIYLEAYANNDVASNLKSGKFQNGVINATYQAQFKIDGVIRNFKWRIQGAHI